MNTEYSSVWFYLITIHLYALPSPMAKHVTRSTLRLRPYACPWRVEAWHSFQLDQLAPWYTRVIWVKNLEIWGGIDRDFGEVWAKVGVIQANLQPQTSYRIRSPPAELSFALVDARQWHVQLLPLDVGTCLCTVPSAGLLLEPLQIGPQDWFP